MASFHDLTTTQLKQAVQIREQIESLQEKLDALLGGAASVTKTAATPTKGKRKFSAGTIEKMRAAQQARYAKLKPSVASTKTTSKKVAPATKSAPTKRVFSPETKAKLAAAMKARWAARKKGDPALNAAKS